MTKVKKKKVKAVMKRAKNVKPGQNDKLICESRSKECLEILAQANEQPVALDVYPY